MQTARVRERSRAEEFVEYLNGRWRGRRTGDQTDATIEDVHLVSRLTRGRQHFASGSR
jgi:hypothetical protein